MTAAVVALSVAVAALVVAVVALWRAVPAECAHCRRKAVVRADAASWRCYACMTQYSVTARGKVGPRLVLPAHAFEATFRDLPQWGRSGRGSGDA